MNIRKKTILTVTFFSLVIVAIGALLANTLFLNSYRRLEKNDIEQDVGRLHAALAVELDNLTSLTRDWAIWVDTYDFMRDHNSAYIESNLLDTTFENLRLNYNGFFDTSHEAVFQKVFDLEAQREVQLSRELAARLANLGDLPQLESGQGIYGVIDTPDAPMLVSLQPILTSQGEGPARGYLIFAKFLKGELFEQLSAATNAHLTLLSIAPGFPSALEGESGLIKLDSSLPEIYVLEKDANTVAFYSPVNDLHGQPIFVFKQEKSRDIYQQGLEGMRSLIVTILVTALAAGAGTLLTLEKNLLARLSSLNKSVQAYRDAPASGRFQPMPGQDEISSLSEEISQTLASLSHTQAKLNGHLKYERLMVEISTTFINLPVNQINQHIVQTLATIGTFTSVERCHVVIFGEEKPLSIGNIFEWQASNITSIASRIQDLKVKSLKWLLEKLKAGESILLNDPAELPKVAAHERAMLADYGIQSILLTPLKVKGDLIGMLTFEMVSQARHWDEESPLIIEIIADIIANAVDRKRSEESIHRSQQFQFQLNQITRTGIEKDNMNSSIRALSRLLPSLINAQQAWLVLTRAEGDLEIYENGRRITPQAHLAQAIQAINERTTNGPFLTRESAAQRTQMDDLTASIGKSCIALPLQAKSQRLGMILFAFKEQHPFSRQEVNFCQQAATQITLAIMKIHSLEEARRISKDLTNLRSSAVEIAAHLDLNQLLKSILQHGIGLLNADGGELLILDESTNELEVAAVLNLDAAPIGSRFKVGEGAAGQAVQQRKPVVMEDYSTWQHRLQIYQESPVKSTIVTPLIVGGKVIGTIGIFHTEANVIFSQDDQNLLSIFTQHAAIALNNAFLFDRVQAMARMDEVTGLMNRRALNEIGHYEVERALRLKRPIAVAMLDLDNFKQINDQHSHLIGDRVLKDFASFLRENVRNIDILGRFGGDECIIIMPETDRESALNAIERIHTGLNQAVFCIENLEFHLRASFGIVAYETNPPSLETLLEQADSAMYAAKQDGRNCVRVFQTP